MFVPVHVCVYKGESEYTLAIVCSCANVCVRLLISSHNSLGQFCYKPANNGSPYAIFFERAYECGVWRGRGCACVCGEGWDSQQYSIPARLQPHYPYSQNTHSPVNTSLIHALTHSPLNHLSRSYSRTHSLIPIFPLNSCRSPLNFVFLHKASMLRIQER